MNIPATGNKSNKLKNSQPQVENKNYTENKIKIDEMKQNMISELPHICNTNTKNTTSEKKK